MSKVIDAQWSGSDRPVVGTVDGCIHMLDISLKKSACSDEERDLSEPVFSPYVCAPRVSFLMKHVLQQQKWRQSFQLNIDKLRDEDQEMENCVNKNFTLIDSKLSEYLDSCRFGTAERCLLTARLYGDESEMHFWKVALHYMRSGKSQSIKGVQLLCLIDKGLDACIYLQTYGAWEKAVWLAKSTLEYTECCEVIKRWVDHLSSTQVNQKSMGMLMMLSLGYFHKVLEMLYGMRQFNRAACFIEAAMEFGLLVKNDENGSLTEAVFLEYGRQLSNLGHKQSAIYYCKQAGSKGAQLLQEVEIPYS